MKIIDIEQGSDEWLALRRTKISATDVSAILGISPYTTAYTLFQRKLGLIPEQEVTYAMTRGSEFESAARDKFIEITGIDMFPCVVEHSEFPWAMASLDGVSTGLNLAVEIKCSEKFLREANQNYIAPHVIAQMAHQMWVLDISQMFFFAYWEGDYKLLTVDRDLDYERVMVEKQLEFYEKLQNFDAPDLCDKDFIERDDPDWNIAVENYNRRKQTYDYYKEHFESARKELIDLARDQCTKGHGLQLTKYKIKGRVDHEKMIKDYDIDEEKYRKKNTEGWRITINE